MKKRWILRLCGIIIALFLLVAFTPDRGELEPVSDMNADNFGKLLVDLVRAYEEPSTEDTQRIREDLRAIRAVNEVEFVLAEAIAEHWQTVFLDPDFRLFLYQGDGNAPELLETEIPNSRSHAFVILGFELKDGQMQEELVGRCEAAAAAARAFPETLIVLSGGDTGKNNPEKHTEAGLMKAYLTERCGIDAARILTDERAKTTAENALNTLEILRENKVKTMTIVTSSYHQRWGQAVYHLAAELSLRRYGYGVEIVGNYCFDIEPSEKYAGKEARIAAQQMAGILGLPKEATAALQPKRPDAAS